MDCEKRRRTFVSGALIKRSAEYASVVPRAQNTIIDGARMRFSTVFVELSDDNAAM